MHFCRRRPLPKPTPHALSAACDRRPSSYAAPPDDDNDLALARLVRKAYLPGVTADTMAAAVAAAPSQFHVSGCRSVWGTEELLELLIAEHLAAAGPEGCAFE